MNGNDADKGNRIVSFLTNHWVTALKTIGSLAGFVVMLLPQSRDVVPWIAGGCAALLALSALYVLVPRYLKHRQDRIAYRIAARKYGYGYEDLEVIAHLKGNTGAMTVNRRLLVRTTSVQNHIRHYLITSSEEADDSLEVGGFCIYEPKDVHLSVTKVPGISRPKGMVIDATFDPPLGERERVDYGVQEEFPPESFATTTDEMVDMHLEHEHLAWHIDKPTRRITFELEIPLPVTEEMCGHDVWYGVYSQQRHRAEFDRVAALFTATPKGNSMWLRMEVPYPVLGLDYVFIWRYDKPISQNQTHGAPPSG